MESIVNITGLAHGGAGVGRVDGKVVFVPFTAPGDEARVEIISDKKSFSEGVLKGLVRSSAHRVEPLCPIFKICGGCSFQHIAYPTQVEWKERIYKETLKRIGGVDLESFDKAAPSPQPFGYRSRARFHVSGDYWGFFELKSHRVVEFDECPILDPAVNDGFRALRDELKGKKLPVFAVDIGVSEIDGKVAAAFHVTAETGFKWERLIGKLPMLKGAEVWLYPVRNDRNRGRLVSTLGDKTLFYSLEDIRLGASISGFSQVNRVQNRALVKRVVEYSGLAGGELVLDLFSGAGNLSLPLAKAARRVIGVEAGKEAVEAAKENASLNAIKNVEFIESDAALWLKREIKNLEKQKPDVIVLDPPRGGEPNAARILTQLRPSKIVYVSCSPPTLARDISVLASAGYKASRAGLFDMFPQTFHIESIVELTLGL